MKPLTTISVSSIQDFQKCQLRWCYRWLENRVPRREPTAFAVGKMVHRAFENHFTNSKVDSRGLGAHLADLLPDVEAHMFLSEHEAKAVKEAQNLIEPLNHWVDMYPIDETLEVETPFTWGRLHGLTFQGRPDRVVRIKDHVFHMQHKTISASRPLDTFIAVAARSMHELLYGEELATKYSDYQYGGTIYNIVRKLKHKSEAKGKNFGRILHEPHEFFLQTTIPITKSLQEIALRDLDILSGDMALVAAEYEKGTMPPSTRGMDEDMFSKRTDPYFDVLMGHASLDDDTRFMDREILYKEPTHETPA